MIWPLYCLKGQGPFFPSSNQHNCKRFWKRKNSRNLQATQFSLAQHLGQESALQPVSLLYSIFKAEFPKCWLSPTELKHSWGPFRLRYKQHELFFLIFLNLLLLENHSHFKPRPPCHKHSHRCCLIQCTEQLPEHSCYCQAIEPGWWNSLPNIRSQWWAI